MGPRGAVSVNYAIQSPDDFVAFLDCGEWAAREAARIETAHANAAYIVLAVNNHEELVEALRKARTALVQLGQATPATLVAYIDAALAKVSGGATNEHCKRQAAYDSGAAVLGMLVFVECDCKRCSPEVSK